MKKFSMVKITAMVILFLGLTGCNWGNGHANSSTSPNTDTEKTSPSVIENDDTGDDSNDADFPEEALAVRPEATEERRSNGIIGSNETYYLSIIAEEEIGCIKRKVDVRGSFFKNQSESWSPGQATEWDSKTTSITITVTEDTTMCGGMLVLSERIVTDNEFSFSISGQSVTFYAEIPVYNAYTGETYNVTISVDGSQTARGELLGGHISNLTNTEWGNEFDSFSNSRGEGVNIVLDGGVYIDNLAIVGNIWAKVSKYTSDYGNNGTRVEDPFYCCIASQKG